ncbi:MAG: hypothetical protein QW342_05615 [Thermoproteota archaeon]
MKGSFKLIYSFFNYFGKKEIDRRILIAILLIPFISASIPFTVEYIVKDLINNPQKVIFTVRTNFNNTIVPYSKVYIFHLTDSGPELLSSGVSDERGVFSTTVGIPRVYKGKLNISGTLRDIYASVNLLVIASKKDEGLLGSLAFSVDPSSMIFPLDFFSVNVSLKKLREQKLGSLTASNRISLLSYNPPNEETWEYTTVVEFSTWDNIFVKFDFGIGTKIDVEVKERVYDTTQGKYITDWYSNGITTVTMDSGLSSDFYTGQKTITEQFYFKYLHTAVLVDEIYWVEHVYAVDTNQDPIADSRLVNSWNGFTSGSNPYITEQNSERTINIYKAYGFVFSVGVSFSSGVSVGLGVSYQSSPAGNIVVKTGTWNSGYRAYTYGYEYGFRKSSTVWKQG